MSRLGFSGKNLGGMLLDSPGAMREADNIHTRGVKVSTEPRTRPRLSMRVCKRLGIKPGSDEFHALKAGRLPVRTASVSTEKKNKGGKGKK